MNKVLIGLLVSMLVSTNVLAEKWMEAAKTDSYTVYIDADSLHKDGRGIKAWTLWDYKKPQNIRGNKFASNKRLTEFDCSAPTFTIRHMEAFSGRMGKGHIISSVGTPESWEHVFPETVVSKLYYLATRICDL